MHPGMSQMAMMRMRMQQGMMREGGPMPNMMPNGAGMEMMGPNGMMMRGSVGPNGPNGPMGGMPRTSGMMQGHGNGMMPGMNMQGNMMGPGHPAMQHGMSNRPPPPEYGMTSQVWKTKEKVLKKLTLYFITGTKYSLHDVPNGDGAWRTKYEDAWPSRKKSRNAANTPLRTHDETSGKRQITLFEEKKQRKILLVPTASLVDIYINRLEK